MEMVKGAEAENPGSLTILRISTVAKLDWRNLRQSDWEEDGWEGEDQKHGVRSTGSDLVSSYLLEVFGTETRTQPG
jgi:hypothetical protein